LKYCVRCGREVDSEEYIADYSMCVDCYLKYHGVFVNKPLLKLTLCPRCGAWRIGEEWVKPLPVEEVIRRVFLNESGKLVDSNVKVLDVYVNDKGVKVEKSMYQASIDLYVVINNAVEKKIRADIVYCFEKTLCPKCFAKAGKIHRALVQVRSEKGWLDEREKQIVMEILSDPGVKQDLVAVEEDKHGLNLKFYTVNIAKRVVSIIVKTTGAKVIESFKPTKYEAGKGRWRGVVTLSVRLPSISRGELVEYKGKLAVVREVTSGGIILEHLEDGSRVTADYEQYWSGMVKKLKEPFSARKYQVIGYDASTLYLLDLETGEMREYPRAGSVKDIREGSIVNIIKFKDKEYLVRDELRVI